MMCGIVGELSFGKPVQISDLKKMMDKIKHRGPDGDGHWINESGAVGFGHRRLAIIDLSEDGRQPMTYADGRYTITLNGEIYNYVELKKELKKKGYRFRTKSDTEVLLALYAESGEDCLQNLDGMYAFAIWDMVEQKLFCARDRFGEKPFYYFHDKGKFVFASEMKALWAYGVQREPNNEQVFLYLGYGKIRNPHKKWNTFYKNISRLEPSHSITVDRNGNLVKKKYWGIDIENQISISVEEATERFYELFETSVRMRLRSDVPVGSSLSGGLDSSSIVAMIDRIKGKRQNQNTFSARFKNFEQDEGEFMQAVIDKCNVEPHFTWLEPEGLLEQMDEVFFHQEEPFNSNSIIAQWNVMKLAKEKGVTVLLDGQGADEILAGYYLFQSPFLREIKKLDRDLYGRERIMLEQNFTDYHPVNSKSFVTGILQSKLVRGVSAKRNRLRAISSRFLRQFDRDFFGVHKRVSVPILKFDTLNSTLKSETLNNLVGLLRYADRNSMAHGREVRLPFLSADLVTFLFSLPSTLKIRDGWSKFILRNAVSGLIPDKITWRKDKIGFAPPNGDLVNEDQFRSSIEALVSERIIDAKNILPDQAWKYYQAAKVFNKT